MSSVTAAAARGSSFDPARAAYRALTSVRFAVALISTLALFGLLGVLIPQVPEAMRGNDAAVSAWVETQRGTFGPLTTPMERLGLFEVFQAKWFLFALGYLVLNVTTCTFNRWSPTFRNVFHPQRRVPEAFFDRAHSRTSFAAVEPARAEEALRGLRFGVRTDVEAGATYIFADRYPWVQLSTFVSHLALILFIAGGLVTSLTGFTADVFAGEGTTTPVFAVSDPRQLQIRVDDAVGVYGEEGNALDFRTRLTIFRNGEEVAAGYSTVNDPLKFGGYRFHQVAFYPDGAALRIRETATGNTIFHETFPLQDSTAAPAVTISDGSGAELVSDVIAPTDFLAFASGTLVDAGDEGLIWIGVTQDEAGAWQAVGFDPTAGDAGEQIRVAIGETAELSGLQVRFDRVVALPAAVGIGVPGGDSDVLAQMTEDADGEPALMLVGEGRPALSLGQDRPVSFGDYEYTFEGRREFTGISVKRDRGAWFIWVATAMLVGGLALTFYVPRRRLWMKLTRERTYVAALAEKSGGFKKEMRVLAGRMGVEPPPEMEEES